MNQINLVHNANYTLILDNVNFFEQSEPYPTRIPQKFCGTPPILFTLNFAQTITYFYKIETHPLSKEKGHSKKFL